MTASRVVVGSYVRRDSLQRWVYTFSEPVAGCAWCDRVKKTFYVYKLKATDKANKQFCSLQCYDAYMM